MSIIKRLIAIMLLGSPLFAAYSAKKAITINHAKVPNSNQTDFPVMISGTYPFLATVANGGSVQSANGYDIVFTSDVGCTVPLSFERESYNATTGAVLFHVKVPSVSYTSDTVIFACYGNAAVTTDQATPAATFVNYSGVWHLQQDPSTPQPQEIDSTGHQGGTATTQGSAWTSAELVAGKFGKALTFDKTQTKYVSLEFYNPNTTGNLTFSAWFKLAATATDNNYILVRGADYAVDGSIGLYIDGSSHPGFMLSNTSSGSAYPANNGTITVDTNWHHMVGTKSGNNYALYYDGVLAGSGTNPNYGLGTNQDNTIFLNIGSTQRGAPYQYAFNGLIEEARIATVARSADWVATEYANQNDPASFYTIADYVPPPTGGTTHAYIIF